MKTIFMQYSIRFIFTTFERLLKANRYLEKFSKFSVSLFMNLNN